jgi:uncharacterized membrane protein
MRISRLLQATVYLTTGTLHFLATGRYIAIMPPYLPAHRALVLLSGAAEIAGGLGLLAPIPAIRRAAAWGIIALLVAVMPANLYMVTAHARFPAIPLWILIGRLPLQLPLIYWAWLYTGPVNTTPADVESVEAV